ncbi:MAG: CE1 family esterase, partial [Planctomycetota bacterium]
MKTAVAIALALLVVLPSAVAEEEDPLTAAVAGLFRARGRHEEKVAVDKILGLKPDPAKVAELLAEGPEYGDPGFKGWKVRKVHYPDGVERPYHLYVPDAYDPAAKAPLLIHMHGGVSRPALLTEDEMKREGYRDWWKEQADEWGFLVVYPLGQQGAMWWDDVGANGLEGVIADVKRDLNVDEDKVFATGFSDGASGAFYLGLTRPTSYAGFIPLNGHPGVGARYSGKQIYLVNQWLRPLYVVATQEDQLYKTAGLLPYIAGYIEVGVQIRFTT